MNTTNNAEKLETFTSLKTYVYVLFKRLRTKIKVKFKIYKCLDDENDIFIILKIKENFEKNQINY